MKVEGYLEKFNNFIKKYENIKIEHPIQNDEVKDLFIVGQIGLKNYEIFLNLTDEQLEEINPVSKHVSENSIDSKYVDVSISNNADFGELKKTVKTLKNYYLLN